MRVATLATGDAAEPRPAAAPAAVPRNRALDAHIWARHAGEIANTLICVCVRVFVCVCVCVCVCLSLARALAVCAVCARAVVHVLLSMRLALGWGQTACRTLPTLASSRTRSLSLAMSAAPDFALICECRAPYDPAARCCRIPPQLCPQFAHTDCP